MVGRGIGTTQTWCWTWHPWCCGRRLLLTRMQCCQVLHGHLVSLFKSLVLRPKACLYVAFCCHCWIYLFSWHLRQWHDPSALPDCPYADMPWQLVALHCSYKVGGLRTVVHYVSSKCVCGDYIVNQARWRRPVLWLAVPPLCFLVCLCFVCSFMLYLVHASHYGLMITLPCFRFVCMLWTYW